MKRFILTGAPGAGKTAILRALERQGLPVVEEAATDTHALDQACGIPEPWASPKFVDDIVTLQRAREEGARGLGRPVLIFDRSPICTLALARHLGFSPSQALQMELSRIEREGVYERRVFFIESLGFMVNTEVRRIGLAEAMRFGELHEVAYREWGYELVHIAPGPVEQRAAAVLDSIAASAGRNA